jgi:hypothetical protein
MLVVQPVAFCTGYKELQAKRGDSSVEVKLFQFEVTTEKTKHERMTIEKLPDSHWYLVRYLPADFTIRTSYFFILD